MTSKFYCIPSYIPVRTSLFSSIGSILPSILREWLGIFFFLLYFCFLGGASSSWGDVVGTYKSVGLSSDRVSDFKCVSIRPDSEKRTKHSWKEHLLSSPQSSVPNSLIDLCKSTKSLSNVSSLGARSFLANFLPLFLLPSYFQVTIPPK